MATIYKGFQMWYCDPSTLENLQFIRNIEITITTQSEMTNSSLQVDKTLEEAKTWLSGRSIAYEEITSPVFGSVANPICLTAAQVLCPMAVGVTENQTGQACKIKLLAANGSFALSDDTIGAGSDHHGTGFILGRYVMYNSDGVSIEEAFYYANRYRSFSALLVDSLSNDAPMSKMSGLYIQSNYNGNSGRYAYITLNTSTVSAAQKAWWNAIGPVVPPPTDPYAPGGTSEPGGGDGTFDFSSEPVDFQDAPTIGAYDTGMISIYVPTAANLQALAAYMWAGSFDPANFRKIVADPMDAIIGLSILPVTDTEIGTTSATLLVGNISTGLTMPRANKQYVVIDCGEIDILPKWGAYLDFAPYSKLQLFLPYIGYVDISPDDCMNGTIAVKYTVDILSGSCVAQVKCNDHVLYEFSGTCSCSCPVTAGQYQNVVMGALRMGGAVASIAGAVASGNVSGAFSGLTEAASTAVDSVKPAISRSGGFGGSTGLMGHQYPYLILTVPRMCIPGDQDILKGYPSFVTANLADITGYCSVETIHLAGIAGASQEDLEEIENLLHGGVYL